MVNVLTREADGLVVAGLTDAAPPSRRATLWSRWGLELVLIVTLAGLLPLLGALAFHSLGKPTSDDWSYLASLADLARHGTLNLNHWATTMTVGQLVVVAPVYLLFGVHPVLACLAVWCVGLVGLVGLSSICRKLGVPRTTAAVLVGGIALCPLFFNLDTTFMTDIPCFTTMVLAIRLWMSCGDAAHSSRRGVALALATLAFTIREPAGLVVLPILGEPLVGAWRQHRPGALRRPLALAGAWCLAVGSLWVWRQHLATTGSVQWHPGLASLAHLWFAGWLPALLGLFTLPVLMTTRPWELLPALIRQHRRRAFAVAVVTIVLPLGWVPFAAGLPEVRFQVGNAIAIDTFIPDSTRFLLYLIGLVALAADVLIVWGAATERRRLGQGMGRELSGISAFAVAYAAVIFGLTTLGLPTFDRYWLIEVAFGALLVQRAGAELDHLRQGTPATVSVIRRLATVFAVALVGYTTMSSYSDNAALNMAAWDATAVAVPHLPAGSTADDIESFWLWNLSAYAADASNHERLPYAGRGAFVWESGDADHSYVSLERNTDLVICAPWSLQALPPGRRPSANAIAVGPSQHGVNLQVQFEVVPVSGANCAQRAAATVRDLSR